MRGSLLSVGEQICSDFGQYLKDLEHEGRCLFLPFKIQTLDMKNIGKFDVRHVEFSRFNVVLGPVGAGKTTLMQAIGSVSGAHRLLKSEQNDGEIDVALSLMGDCFISTSVSLGTSGPSF